jgi:ABC-type molybdate transport system permease subunit
MVVGITWAISLSLASYSCTLLVGSVGLVRAYLIAVRNDKDAEMKEIIIDVPLALSKMLTGFSCPWRLYKKPLPVN